jgi:cobalt-zinc-cadmium efflux system membrane fusion protein
MKSLKHLTLAALVALGISVTMTGCSRDKSAEAASEKAADQPKLFSIPAEQMSHIKIMTVQPSSIERVLRLPGTVAYNGFTTTPVISQVSGPVGRIVVVPGQIVHAGEPMLYVSSPDFAQLRSNYLKASDAHALAHKNYAR